MSGKLNHTTEVIFEVFTAPAESAISWQVKTHRNVVFRCDKVTCSRILSAESKQHMTHAGTNSKALRPKMGGTT